MVNITTLAMYSVGGAISGSLYGIAIDVTGKGSLSQKLANPLFNAIEGAVIGAGAYLISDLILMRFL